MVWSAVRADIAKNEPFVATEKDFPRSAQTPVLVIHDQILISVWYGSIILLAKLEFVEQIKPASVEDAGFSLLRKNDICLRHSIYCLQQVRYKSLSPHRAYQSAKRNIERVSAYRKSRKGFISTDQSRARHTIDSNVVPLSKHFILN